MLTPASTSGPRMTYADPAIHPAATMSLSILQGGLHEPDVQSLLALHFAAMRSQSPREACHVLPLDRLYDPAITFFTARDGGGQLQGIGALKELDSFHGEIKSMRTAAHALGRGVGRSLLQEILSEAQRRGYRRVSLETGNTQDFGAALSLYRSAGFRECLPFGDYQPTRFTVFLSLDLRPALHR